MELSGEFSIIYYPAGRKKIVSRSTLARIMSIPKIPALML
jgi:hypothetical protein